MRRRSASDIANHRAPSPGSRHYQQTRADRNYRMSRHHSARPNHGHSITIRGVSCKRVRTPPIGKCRRSNSAMISTGAGDSEYRPCALKTPSGKVAATRRCSFTYRDDSPARHAEDFIAGDALAPHAGTEKPNQFVRCDFDGECGKDPTDPLFPRHIRRNELWLVWRSSIPSSLSCRINVAIPVRAPCASNV